ncbi:MAG TPA: sigma-70 family RNA polymerase sigma factor [Treponemataceae bacterium]|nr:sigma-70 family RNA polymerase sigma factor [Treponemataceae bacterium]
MVKRVLEHDNAAFAQLISLYERKVRAMGYSFFKNTTDTDDFVQDVFLRVYAKLSTFRGEAQFSTWLIRIAYNIAINSKNRRKEYASLAEDFDLIDKDYTPEERQLRTLTAATVREAIATLPENYGICIDMYFFYDFAYNEISVITGLPINTIKSNVFRAKKILKEKLEKLLGDIC